MVGLDACGEGALREGRELSRAGVAPDARFACLAAEEGGDGWVALGVDRAGEDIRGQTRDRIEP